MPDTPSDENSSAPDFDPTRQLEDLQEPQHPTGLSDRQRADARRDVRRLFSWTPAGRAGRALSFISRGASLARDLEDRFKGERGEEPRTQPFHLEAERNRVRELDKAERELGKEGKAAERGASRGQWDFNPSEAPGVERARSKVEALRSPSLSEAMSKSADSLSGRQAEQQRLSDAKQGALMFERNGLSGTAGEKYQYLLQTAIQQRDKSHFDRLHYPDRVLHVEQSTAEQLYVDGYDSQEIKDGIRSHSPFILGTNESQYLDTITSRFNGSYPHPDLSQARHERAMWRLQARIPETSRHTPQEWEVSQRLRDRNAEALSWGKLKEAEQVFEQYRQNPQMRLTTTQEYQVELARIHEKSPHLQNYDTRTAMKLIIAGHKPKEITEALNEASPFSQKAGYASFEKGGYGTRTVDDALAFLKQEEALQQSRGVIKSFKREHQWNETRLDKLGIAHNQQVPAPSSATETVTYSHEVSPE